MPEVQPSTINHIRLEVGCYSTAAALYPDGADKVVNDYMIRERIQVPA